MCKFIDYCRGHWGATGWARPRGEGLELTGWAGPQQVEEGLDGDPGDEGRGGSHCRALLRRPRGRGLPEKEWAGATEASVAPLLARSPHSTPGTWQLWDRVLIVWLGPGRR